MAGRRRRAVGAPPLAPPPVPILAHDMTDPSATSAAPPATAQAMPPSAWPRGRARRAATIAAVCAVMAAGVTIAYLWGERVGIRAQRDGTAHRIEAYIGGLRSEMRRYEYLPAVVALNHDVQRLLREPDTPGLPMAANRFLAEVNAAAKSTAIYVMDAHGLTLAASNWNEAASFVGINFSYRPYFRDAMQGKPGRFYGIGTVSREPGYYFSQPIVREGALLGVAAVKVNLDKIDEPWLANDDRILVVDANGIVFLSSQPDWRFKSLRELPSETRWQLASTRQYSTVDSLEPIGFREQRRFAPDISVVQMPDGDEFLAQSRRIPDTDWRLIVLSDMEPIRTLARNSAVIGAFALGFLLLLILYVLQRRRAAAQNRAAKEALQRAHDELERKVAMRTQALSGSNLKLQKEIAERKRAEQVLKAAMDELVQASKMAALGQMSTGITHELNQPLAALRTLSANTIVFFRRGQTEAVETNLNVICQMVERMGKITAQLKKFARKTPVQSVPTPVGTVIADALFLLDSRIRAEGAELVVSVPEPSPLALCEGNRLEQVLVNLLSNALDAMKDANADAAEDPAARVLEIRTHADPQWVTIEVADRGCGIDDDVMPRLFEPFFTTKEQGVGLGLGLAISAGIVREFGGTLRAENRRAFEVSSHVSTDVSGNVPGHAADHNDIAGARFIIQLPAAQETHADAN
ncbi:sensor histidine kinase [Cupriavidus cauae]|uniref:C4-dicarboxylate transport sensor protein DctB n=2 Tax=Cupriavidus cauae TaxID=2608999 RepID=A0A5M8AL36_9BURK|nr:sensor histidine kinase [Cupriavidus cauae]